MAKHGQERAAFSSSPHPFNTSAPAAAATAERAAALGSALWARAGAWMKKSVRSTAAAWANAAAVAGARGAQALEPQQQAYCPLNKLALFCPTKIAFLFLQAAQSMNSYRLVSGVTEQRKIA